MPDTCIESPMVGHSEDGKSVHMYVHGIHIFHSCRLKSAYYCSKGQCSSPGLTNIQKLWNFFCNCGQPMARNFWHEIANPLQNVSVFQKRLRLNFRFLFLLEKIKSLIIDQSRSSTENHFSAVAGSYPDVVLASKCYRK